MWNKHKNSPDTERTETSVTELSWINISRFKTESLQEFLFYPSECRQKEVCCSLSHTPLWMEQHFLHLTAVITLSTLIIYRTPQLKGYCTVSGPVWCSVLCSRVVKTAGVSLVFVKMKVFCCHVYRSSPLHLTLPLCLISLRCGRAGLLRWVSCSSFTIKADFFKTISWHEQIYFSTHLYFMTDVKGVLKFIYGLLINHKLSSSEISSPLWCDEEIIKKVKMLHLLNLCNKNCKCIHEKILLFYFIKAVLVEMIYSWVFQLLPD